MKKIILLTGASDGIGLETAKLLANDGHHLILHGRNQSKVDALKAELEAAYPQAQIDSLIADLSSKIAVVDFIEQAKERYTHIDIIINNAGVYQAANSLTADKLDLRFVVNTFAPYLISRDLMSLLPNDGRIVNLSSAAQATVNLEAMAGKQALSAGEAYAQSKLGLTMWSQALAQAQASTSRVIVAVNPASFLGSKMVKDAYGIDGGDLSVGANILYRAALSAEFNDASGKYFDNDAGRFSPAHGDCRDSEKVNAFMQAMDKVITQQFIA